jgi:predicted ATPase
VRKEHPLALFLDDLQWLDSATLDLLGGAVRLRCVASSMSAPACRPCPPVR